jgi:hypothetical protein
MKPLTPMRLLALAAPALALSTVPVARAGGAIGIPPGEVVPLATRTAAPTPAAAPAPLASLAAALRGVVAALAANASRPMVDHDGCPLPGNVGKRAAGMTCATQIARAAR